MERGDVMERTTDGQAEEIQEDEMETSGHGDALQGAVDKAAGEHPARKEANPGADRVDPEDMDIRVTAIR